MSYTSHIQTAKYAPEFSGTFALKIKTGLPQKTLFMAQFALLLLLAVGQAIAAYTPPVGIPLPGFGIDEERPARPSSWDMEIPGYYYIDQTNGSDQTYGTPSAPRRYLPNPIPAGSYIELHGTYNSASGGVTWINGNGDSSPWVANVSGPVWVVGENAANAPTFTRETVIRGTYVYVDTIKVSNGGKLSVGSSAPGRHANHVMVRNSDLTGVVSAGTGTLLGASGRDDGGTIVHNIIFYNNKVHDTGDINATYDLDATGIGVGGAHHVWILNNEVYNTAGTGIQLNGQAQTPTNTHHLYIGFNRIYNVRQSGVGVKWASDIVISQNILHDIIDTRGLYTTGDNGSPSKGIGFQYGPQRLWMIYNEIYNCSFGIRGASTSSSKEWYVYAIGNIIHDIHAPSGNTYSTTAWAEAGIMMQGGTYRYIVNNTLYNVDAGINGPSVGTYYYLNNNIISNITQPNGSHVFIEHGSSASQSTLNNSLFYNPDSGIQIKWGSTVSDSLLDFSAATGQCATCYETDPQLLSTTEYKLKPSNGSEAIDNGAANDVYDTFQSLYKLNLNIAVDYSGTNRPQGFGWDIGAHEYVPSIPPMKTTLTVK